MQPTFELEAAYSENVDQNYMCTLIIEFEDKFGSNLRILSGLMAMQPSVGPMSGRDK